jgi:hypothetical protein
MNRRELIELLALHAEPGDANLSEERPAILSPEITSLMNLASSLKQAMVPVTAASFEARLRQELLGQPSHGVSMGRVSSGGGPWWLALGALLSGLTVAGLVVLLVRRLRFGPAGA